MNAQVETKPAPAHASMFAADCIEQARAAEHSDNWTRAAYWWGVALTKPSSNAIRAICQHKYRKAKAQAGGAA